MTYLPKAPWVPLEDLVLTKTLPERVKYVRDNLEMTQRELAAATGMAAGHHAVTAWERPFPKGTEPKAPVRERLSALTGGAYPAAVFSRAGAEALVVEIAVPRLRILGERYAWLREQMVRLAETVDLELELEREPPGDQSVSADGGRPR